MGEPSVDQNQLEQIGSYIKSHLGQWIREGNVYPFPPQAGGNDNEILRKIDNVEQQLKFQNEKLEQMMVQSDKRFETLQTNMGQRFEAMQSNMDQRFEAVDKRFEDQKYYFDKRFETMQHSMDKRFEDQLHFMDKRLGLQTWIIGGGFTLMGTLITLFKFLA